MRLIKSTVFSIDVDKDAFQKTKGRGHMIVVDPYDGKYVYTGIQKPIQDVLIIEDLGVKSSRFRQRKQIRGR